MQTRIVLSVGDTGDGTHFALTIRAILQAQAEGIAREVLAGRQLPGWLYHSGVRYRTEPARGTGVEYFDDPWTVAARGWGDCDDLVAWRCGELLAHGEAASVCCHFLPPRYHVSVRRQNGAAEDPAKILIAMYGR